MDTHQSFAATADTSSADTIEAKQANQKSSLKWILSKAFNNQVPENLREPFYRDLEGQDHIKPQIVVGLGNASLYCQTLSNLYSDPNYQSLNHWSILQTLTRKGVPAAETGDVQLTETVLIQTNPLRINAHMLVIDALMILYAKEVATGDRIAGTIARLSGGTIQRDKFNYETGLLCWISHACAALKRRIDLDIEQNTESEFTRLQSPNIPPIRDYRDLCDGACLAFLISHYCPRVVPWTSVRVNYLPTVEDSVYNILLVSNFSQKHLPYSVFHMTPPDITYMRGSMRHNLIALLADLYNLFEVHPSKCVNYPGMEQQSDAEVASGGNEHGIAHRRGFTCQPVIPIPDLRSGLESPTSATSPPHKAPFQVNRSTSATSMRRITPPPAQQQHSQQQQQQQLNESTFDEDFVVHRGRTIPTLATAMQDHLMTARLRQAKEKSNTDSKAEERGDMATAGRPSNWEDARRPSYAGRRSRRNSFTEDSQLTIENFGGSQDQINMLGRHPEPERKFSSSTLNFVTEPAVAVRSSIADARGTLQISYNEHDSGSEKQDRETEKLTMRRQTSMDNVSLSQMKHSKDEVASPRTDFSSSSSATPLDDDANTSAKKKASFATLPNTTTWQQQQLFYQQSDNNVDDDRPHVDATKLSTIRMKLEEKRRQIEQEKRRMEMALSKQQQKVGKAAFLQAINKKLDVLKSDGQTVSMGNRVRNLPSADTASSHNSTVANSPDSESLDQSEADSTKQEPIDVHGDYLIENKRTPDSEADVDHYQENIALMNSSLKDIQKDIHRLTTQQSQMHAQHIQASQLLQAQQIANMINQFGSHRNIPGPEQHQQARFGGSTPHLPQQLPQPPATYNLHDQYSMLHQQSPPPLPQSSVQPPQPMARHFYNAADEALHHQQQHHQQTMQQYSQPSYAHQEINQYHTYRVDHQQHRNQSPDVNLREASMSPPQPTTQFFLHDSVPSPHQQQLPSHYHEQTPPPQSQPTPPARRTWAQQSPVVNQPQLPLDINAWAQNSPKPDNGRTTWKNSASPYSQTADHQQHQPGGFVLHHHNGHNESHSSNHQQYTSPLSKSSELNQSYPNLFAVHESSPNHQRVQRQISQIIGVDHSRGNGRVAASPNNHNNGHQVNVPPSIDDMAPQSISFIGDEQDTVDRAPPPPMAYAREEQLITNYPHHPPAQYSSKPRHDQQELDLGKLNITSGKLTYRIPSPTRPSLNLNSFEDPSAELNEDQKGFYVAFDNVQPKRPKPPLRTKRSPKKERSVDQKDDQTTPNSGGSLNEHMNQLENELKTAGKVSGFVSKQHNVFEKSSDDDHQSISAKHFSHQQQQQQPLRQHYSMLSDEAAPNHRHTLSSNHIASTLNYQEQAPQAAHRHLEDLTNRRQVSQLQPQMPSHSSSSSNSHNTNHHHDSNGRSKENKLVVDVDTKNLDPDSVDEMERKKEKIMLLSLQRRQQQEEAKARKEVEAMQRREREQLKQEERERKQAEQVARRAAILEQHKFKKAIEEAEQKGLTIDRTDLMMMKQQLAATSAGSAHPSSAAKMRANRVVRPRPKTIHVETSSVDLSEASSFAGRNTQKKGSNSNLTGIGGQLSSNSMRRDYYRGSQDSLAIRESPDEYPSTSSTPIGRRGSYKTTREPTVERGRTISRISVAKGSNLNFRGRKSNSLMNLCDTDSGLGRATPPRRAPSPGMGPSGRHLPSPSGPGSLPPGFMNKRRIYDDGSSDISSAASSMMEYSGPKLYKQPATKSNRGIILNAVEYCVFPGVVNRDAKQKVLEKIARSEAKHFLVLFRDAGCQFRALYGYYPENESVHKLYGTGPNQVDEFMFDKFFKYNSGGKCFSQVHTKHLTVTIDAFTIHNSLWQGKKVAMPSKRDMTLVI